MGISLSILTILLCGIFWRLGGWRGDLKPFRAFGIPIVIIYGKTLISGYSPYVFLYLPALWIMMSLFSYGLSAPPHKFWVWALGKGEEGNVWVVEFLTRATAGLFWACAASLFLLCGASWVSLIGYVIFLTLANGFIGASRLNATWSEFLVGASVAMCVLI